MSEQQTEANGTTETVQAPTEPIEHELVDKRYIQKMLDCCERTVDKHMANGMPHMKLSPRMVRFDPVEVKQWCKSQYGLRRRKAISPQSGSQRSQELAA